MISPFSKERDKIQIRLYVLHFPLAVGWKFRNHSSVEYCVLKLYNETRFPIPIIEPARHLGFVFIYELRFFIAGT